MTGNPTRIVRLPVSLDAASARGLVAALCDVPADAELVLDAGCVASLSVGYVQVLLAAMKTHGRVRIANASAEFSAAFAAFGFSYVAAPEPEEARPSRTILTIDDSRTMRDMLRLTLSGAGFRVVQAVDGEDGLRTLAAETVDVIITDINMPKLDGYGVIREVRRNSAYDRMPILVLSTENEEENRDFARNAGATGWVVKPFEPARLVEVLQRVCP